MKSKQPAMYKGLTAEGPNKLSRSGAPTPFKKHRKKSAARKKAVQSGKLNDKKLLSTNQSSKLRNQLYSLRQNARPIKRKHGAVDTKSNHSALAQSLEWNKLKSSPFNFKSLTKRSLLFSVEEMSKIDKVTVYYIGKSGLQQLCELDAKFERYKRILFNDDNLAKLRAFDRAQVDDERELKTMDTEVIDLLRDLCDYFLLEECHKVLEYLVSFFKIHLNFAVYSLEMALPYYSTVTFARFVQLIEFSEHRWQLLLLNVQKHLSPLTKETLVKQCLKDHSLLSFVQEMLDRNGESATVRKFYTELLLNVLRHQFVATTQSHKSNKLLLRIVPHLMAHIGGLQSGDSALMLLNFISVNVQLNPVQGAQIMRKLVASLNRHKPRQNEHLLLTLDQFMHSQNVTRLHDDLVDALLTFNADGDAEHEEQLVRTLIAIRYRFHVRLATILVQQFLVEHCESARHAAFVRKLLAHFEFGASERACICDTLLANLESHKSKEAFLALLQVVKSSASFAPALNDALVRNKAVITSANLELLVSADSLTVILQTSAVYDDADVVATLTHKIVHDLKSVPLLLMMAQQAMRRSLFAVVDSVAHALFAQKRVLLADADTAQYAVQQLMAMVAQLKVIERFQTPTFVCRVLDFVCFAATLTRAAESVADMNVYIIDMLASIPVANAAATASTSASDGHAPGHGDTPLEQLLAVLNTYACDAILVYAKDLNRANLLSKIGENVLRNHAAFLELIPRLSTHSHCLLLLCLQQNISAASGEHVMQVLIALSSFLCPPKENEITALVCTIFNDCVHSIRENANFEHTMTPVFKSLVERDAGHHRLIQIVAHHVEQQAMVKLLLSFVTGAISGSNGTKIKCLYILSSLLAKPSSASLMVDEACLTSILWSLMLQLTSKNKSVRFAAIQCLKSVRSNHPIFAAFMRQLREFSDDVVDDAHTLHRMFVSHEHELGFDAVARPMFELFVRHGHVTPATLALMAPVLIHHKHERNADAVHSLLMNACRFLERNREEMRPTELASCAAHICGVFTHERYYRCNRVDEAEFTFLNECLLQFASVEVLDLLRSRDAFWRSLSARQQQTLYLNLETLFEQDHALQQRIVDLVMAVPFSASLTTQLLRVEQLDQQEQTQVIRMMTRLQFMLGKLNNQSMDNRERFVNRVLLPLVMALMKRTHANIDAVSSRVALMKNKKKKVADNASDEDGKQEMEEDEDADDDEALEDDLGDVDIGEFVVVPQRNQRDRRSPQSAGKKAATTTADEALLQTLAWLRSLLLSVLITVLKQFGAQLKEHEFEVDTLIGCMQFEYLLLNNNLLIEFVCMIGRCLPALLLQIYKPFMQFIASHRVSELRVDVSQHHRQHNIVLLSLLTEFFDASIAFISPLIESDAQLTEIIGVTMELIAQFEEQSTRLQFASLLAKSLCAQHPRAISMIFGLLYASVASAAAAAVAVSTSETAAEQVENTTFFNRLLLNATNNNITLQLQLIANLIETVTAEASEYDDSERDFYFLVIANQLNHSAFIREFSTVVLENNDRVPSEVDALSTQLFKALFRLSGSGHAATPQQQCLDHVRGLMSLKSFVAAIKQLLVQSQQNGQNKLVLKALQLVKDQIEDKSEKFKLNDAKQFLHEILVYLHSNVLFAVAASDSKYGLKFDEFVLLILDKSVKKLHRFAVMHDWLVSIVPSFMEALRARHTTTTQNNGDGVICSHVLLLLCTLVNVLPQKQVLLPQFGEIIKVSLAILATDADANADANEQDELLTLSAMFCLECMMRDYRDYIGPYLVQILQCVLGEKLLRYQSTKSMALYVQNILRYLATSNSSKLIPALKTVFTSLFVTSKSGAFSLRMFETFFSVVGQMIAGWTSRSDTVEHHKALFELFKYCMDFRLLRGNDDGNNDDDDDDDDDSEDNNRRGVEQVQKFEFVVLDCFSCLVLKLTDAETTDIVEKLIFWVQEYEVQSARFSVRGLLLFRFLYHCLSKFKAPFCKIAIFCYGLAINCLQSERDCLKSSPAHKKRKLSDGQAKPTKSGPSKAEKMVLVQRANYIIQTIQLTLKYGSSRESEQLVEKSTFLMLVPVLMDQIKHGMDLRDELMYTAYFEKYLSPTIVCLANATKDVNMWNELNSNILRLCGAKHALVRSAAVDALLGLFGFMSHSWLNCLPQTLHIIHELMQDNDDDVVQRSKLLVERIENLTSSKLNNLL